MKDAFHGSAHPSVGLDLAHRGQYAHALRPYRGCTKVRPRRGVARTAPQWILRAGGHCADHVPRVALHIDVPWASIPCWSGRSRQWVHTTVPKAYKERYDTHVRPVMPGNPVSLKTVVAVAEARASFADHRTGRECRPTNARLAGITGLSVRTVQRASTTLRLLGVATEVVRGRQRTRAERFASWRVGDRGRGWASVWALHDNRFRTLSPHPGGSLLVHKTSPKKSLTTTSQRQGAGRSAAPRRRSLDQQGLALANAWLCDEQSPPWARRYRTGAPWAAILAGPARHGWTPRDLNQLLTDWIGTGHWLPDSPHKPIGLLGKVLATHGNLEERPSALDVAREEAELAAARQRVQRQFEEREVADQARQSGRAALGGSGHAAARHALNEIAARRRRRGGGTAR
ncbi:hypothetical protein EV580_6638 [Mycobacterium sp. BK086]|nr:hypothetical protein EV580_6638 [Mycobacterium sp. BK086]